MSRFKISEAVRAIVMEMHKRRVAMRLCCPHIYVIIKRCDLLQFFLFETIGKIELSSGSSICVGPPSGSRGRHTTIMTLGHNNQH